MIQMFGVVLGCACLVHFVVGYIPTECTEFLDIGFVVDGSDSLDDAQFGLLRSSLHNMTDHFNVGENKTRIGMLVFSSTVPKKYFFSSNPAEIKSTAKSLFHPKDGTMTDLGIGNMTEMFKHSGRPDVPKIMIVITDGKSKFPKATKAAAMNAAQYGITVVSVGIGSRIGEQELRDIASSNKLVYTIKSIHELLEILKSMVVKICPCPEPPTLPLAKCNKGPRAIGSERFYECQEGYKRMGNPKITCQDDFTWTLLSADFACLACGDTPKIDYGGCLPGKNTISTVRHFKCDEGYRPKGKNTITCIDDKFNKKKRPTWSEHNFQCLPCGPTKKLENGFCGGDDYRIDAIRKYECHLGYRAVGNPYIQCMDDSNSPTPIWNTTNFRCLPCGSTPPIKNGLCEKSDDFRIGNIRQLSCLPGYRAVGKSTIECLDDKHQKTPTWSEHNFQCLPCGSPDDIGNAFCGGDDRRIDAIRKYECHPGYRAVGNPYIQCLDDINSPTPVWNTTDFQCLPCGPIPEIPFGSCGSGNDSIGSIRHLTCDDGYIAVGKPQMECVDDLDYDTPVWKYTFKCQGCGNPPYVPNAYYNYGPDSIGSVVNYACDPDYEMRGPGYFTCMADGQWKGRRFVCEPILPTTPAPNNPDPSACDECRYINGVGFAPHPYDCNQYTHCSPGKSGGLEPNYELCPFGLFWDNDILTCNYPMKAKCATDPCRDKPDGYTYQHNDPKNCCAYWICEDHYSTGKCCGEGMRFRNGECVYDPKCTSKCPYEDELPSISSSDCKRFPNQTHPNWYHQYTDNGLYYNMPCAPGTIFDETTCECSLTGFIPPPSVDLNACRAELDLPLRGHFRDVSKNRASVTPIGNVRMTREGAYFDGRSKLIINMFANMEFGEEVVIKFRYKEDYNHPNFHDLQALVSNGDCEDDPTIIIAKLPNHVLMGAKAKTSRSFAIPTESIHWKDVVYYKSPTKLDGHVCGGSYYEYMFGNIRRSLCALQIGYGTGLIPFAGTISDFKVYSCRPPKLFEAISDY